MKMMMMEMEEIRNAGANLQIDIYQIKEMYRMLEEKQEILELRMDEILEAIGKK